MEIPALALFAIALAVNSGIPGPTIVTLVSRVITNGWRDVLPFVTAIWIVELIWLTAAMAGIAALAPQLETGLTALKWFGVAYLLFLAWRMWTQPAPDGAAEDTETREAIRRAGSGWSMFAAGASIHLGNPKLIVFYVALLPSLLDLSDVGIGDWARVALVMLAVIIAVDLGWMFAAERARRFLRTPRAMRLTNRIGATALGGAAAAIATRP
ncbi:MAG: LysE family translocator [Pseudomonadota bacterium]